MVGQYFCVQLCYVMKLASLYYWKGSNQSPFVFSFGDAEVDHLDILAPILQCCQ